MTLQAYAAARSRAETPRATEHRLIGEITGEMMDAQNAGLTGPALVRPLHRNREMWSTFATDCAAQGNGLPAELRAQIVSIALWVDRHTSAVMAGRESIGDLIDVNRNIMEGLRGERLAA
ncbi:MULTISPECIES: flagellar biosynthesis regulator FlaF [unclassified Sphingosinithalassobacter]|uniref:flagellar biosynthesis regulator FlaF n=1 Tax=unclassified Sphingosinithalassobacter TaxID=2676235 RepID=UPI00165E7A67|nr:flagellar biosynthesis regulator FlaF [Sphingosinithalassobacter sp. CS137]